MTNNTQKSATECREALCTLCGSETLPCKCKYLANVPHRAMVTIPKFEYAKLLVAHADTMRLVEMLSRWRDADIVAIQHPLMEDTEALLSQHTGGKA